MNCPICDGQAELQYRMIEYGELKGSYECLECHETFEAEIEEADA